MFDMNQAQQTLQTLQKAAIPHPINPALPFDLAIAKREVELLFGPDKPDRTDVVQDIFTAVSKWLTK